MLGETELAAQAFNTVKQQVWFKKMTFGEALVIALLAVLLIGVYWAAGEMRSYAADQTRSFKEERSEWRKTIEQQWSKIEEHDKELMILLKESRARP
jgi:hypothetical protein